MAKTTATNPGDIIPRPVLNTPATVGVWSALKPIPQPMPAKKAFVLLDKAGEVVATLINRELAEKWIADSKKGAVKITEGVLALAV